MMVRNIIWALISFWALSLQGQKVLDAPFMSVPPDFDGNATLEEWEDIPTVHLMMQVPNFGSEGSQYGETRLAYDRDYIYLSGRLFLDDPDLYRGTTYKRDAFDGTTNYFGMVIDSYNDYENALAFFTTPTGLRWDGTVANDAQSDDDISVDWNTFWDVKTLKTDYGWSVEMRIPWSSLRFQSINGEVVMGITIWRYLGAKNEVDIYPLIPLEWGGVSQWKPSQTQRFRFQNIENDKPLYITPYLLAGYQQMTELGANGQQYETEDSPKFEGGFDLKYSLTSNLTLDITANTDFAQVEADDQQVNLSRFNLFFPEKRQFFLERASIFDFNFDKFNRLFYSRRIGIFDEDPVRIYGGARLQGRIQGHDLGFMTMQTESPADSLTSENFSVLRVRRQAFNPYSYLGFIAANRMDLDGSFNTTYGLDGILRLFGDEYLDIKWAQSFENGRANQVFSLDPARIYLNWERRRYDGFNYNLAYSRVGEDWSPQIGFEERESYNSLNVVLKYGKQPGESSRILRWEYVQDWFGLKNFVSGKVELGVLKSGINFETRKGWNGLAGFKIVTEYVPETFELGNTEVPLGDYDYYDTKFELGSPYGYFFGASATLKLGEFYDGDFIQFNIAPRYRINSHLSVEGYYEYNYIDFTERQTLFESHVGRVKVEYLFDTKLSLAAFLQYNSIDQIFTPNIRLRYNPREGNDLFLVFNDLVNNKRMREIPHLPQSEERVIVLKYTYTFKL